MFDTTGIHPDGERLIREFLERDGRGDFLQADDWFAGATDCPGHEPGPDSYILIADQRVEVVSLSDSVQLGLITESRLGLVSPGARGMDELDPDPMMVTDTIRAIRTRFGWRIASPALRQHVLRSSRRDGEIYSRTREALQALGRSGTSTSH